MQAVQQNPRPGPPPGAPAPAPGVPQAVIQVDHVTKQFGTTVGVDDINFQVYAGEIFGFIGPSGSGKTTTMRLLNGIYTPTKGTVRLLGVNPAKPTRALHEDFGYMPQQFVLYPNLTIYENINFLAAIQGLGWIERRKRIQNLLEFVELWDARNRLTENTSGGMQRRLELAGALIHDPRLLFVDEPTAGIDPVLRAKFWEEFRRLRDEGRTLFVTTQYVGESEYCDRVGVIRKGRLIAIDTPLNLRRMALGGDVIDVAAAGLTPGAVQSLTLLDIVREVQPISRGEMRVFVNEAGSAIPTLLESLNSSGCSVKRIEEYRPSFDDVFIELMKRDVQARGESDEPFEAD